MDTWVSYKIVILRMWAAWSLEYDDCNISDIILSLSV